MSEKLRLVRVKMNPSATKLRRRRKVKRPPAPGRRLVQKRMRPQGRAYVIEVMSEKNKLFRFRYWSGRKLVTTRTGALKFPSETSANAAARRIIKTLPAEYRFVRVVPA